MASLAVSRLISVKDMASLVGQGMTDDQISERLRIKHPASKGLSSMSVWRFCKKIMLEETVSYVKKNS